MSRAVLLAVLLIAAVALSAVTVNENWKYPLDPSTLIPISQVISNVLSSFKTARDMARNTTDPELQAQLANAYDGLNELRERLLDLDEENRRLKAELAKQSEVVGPFPPFGYFYQKTDVKKENPLCPVCFQLKEKMVSFMGPLTSWNHGIRRTCRHCGKPIYEKEMVL